MNRRAFILGVPAGCVLGLLAAPLFPGWKRIPLDMPKIEWTVLPPLDRDMSDPMGSIGYVGGAFDYRGERYIVIAKRTPNQWGLHDDPVADMKAEVETKLRVQWESINNNLM